MRLRKIRTQLNSERLARHDSIGDMGVLAAGVILQARADILHLDSGIGPVRAAAEDARAFIFSDRIEPWAHAAQIDVRMLRNSILHPTAA
jgi:hypothetical protein